MDVILPCVKHPTTLIRKIHGQYLDVGFNPITKQQAVEKLFENLDPGVVVKISRASSGGKGVRFLGKGSTRDDISDALDVDRDVAVQLVMQQHPEMAKMNASSVNTIRIICIMLDGESIPLSAVVRIGNSGSRVDNFSSGGVGCGVKPDGHLNDCGYTQRAKDMMFIQTALFSAKALCRISTRLWRPSSAATCMCPCSALLRGI